MNQTAAARLMTTEELLALPDDGQERWLLEGRLWEKAAGLGPEANVTIRNRWHSRILARIAQLLGVWLDAQPTPRGEVLVGEVGVRLRRNPDTTVGVDLIYIGPDLAAREPTDTRLIDGVPILAVEILSPSDTQEEIHSKVREYLTVGVALVWIVDPQDRTILTYRPGAEPELFNVRQELSGDPHLPGFRAAVAQVFGR